ncbi:penicillin-insensitive murein endopeptidase [Pseudogemmobacter sp. W21_MBD1_M6]|uniref:penicillin-insensitive murein endopeptidase n=1 Tax=Pseudogemmobacter sp. W21_MBD1_M6 TaxID=3240271 RepID=UPI003F99AC1C
MVRFLTFITLVLGLAAPAMAQQKANTLFGAMRAGSSGNTGAIGTYAKGCIDGAVELPETGPTWQAMRLSRNRNWGHPDLVAFLQRLSVTATRQGWAGLYIGDMGQPRGGPMTSGHQSHQMGLDADVWMLPPKRLNLSRSERENLSSISVRTDDQTRVNANWTPAHYNIMKAAALDPAIDRIFVAAAVKVEMCKTAKRSDKKWLQKIRPLYGHNFHFHVRLKCPTGSAVCQTQSPTVSELSKGGDGCDDSLNWWVTTYLDQLRNPPKPKPGQKPAKPKRGSRDYTMEDLPRQCQNVLASR